MIMSMFALCTRTHSSNNHKTIRNGEENKDIHVSINRQPKISIE